MYGWEMDEDLPQLFELIREKVGTAERASRLIDLIEETFKIGQPIPLVGIEPLVNREGDYRPDYYAWDVTIKAISDGWTIQVIKVVRDHLGLSLRDCAQGVRSLPWMVATELGYDRAQALKRDLERVWATVGLRGVS